MQDIVFVNIGWMLEYQGNKPSDPIQGGHGHLRKHKEGHEACNFKASEGQLFGYVPGRNNMRIVRFANRLKDRATGVTVVWVARHPESRRYVVVGWYRRATISKLPKPGPWRLRGDSIDCQIV